MALSVRGWVGANWFWLVMPLLVAIEWAALRSIPAGEQGPFEAIALFDLCIFVPALFALCYARSLSPRALAVRLLGLACLGLLLASWFVPQERQLLLPQLGWFRAAGLVALGAIEVIATVAVMRMVFSGKADAEAIATRAGVPAWVARLMLLEMQFWRWVWQLLRGRRP